MNEENECKKYIWDRVANDLELNYHYSNRHIQLKFMRDYVYDTEGEFCPDSEVANSALEMAIEDLKQEVKNETTTIKG